MGYRANMKGAVLKVKVICSNRKVGQMAASTAEKLMQPYVPEREGALIGSAVATPFKVTYSTPYAHYQWLGISKNGKPLNYTKLTATSHWEKQVNKQELANSITNYLKVM